MLTRLQSCFTVLNYESVSTPVLSQDVKHCTDFNVPTHNKQGGYLVEGLPKQQRTFIMC